MTRLNDTFKRLKEQNKKAFSVFLMSSYPDFNTSLDIMHLCSNTNVDFIELGMPFSDPSADGPIIKMAGEYSISHGTTIKQTINLIKEFRKENNHTPIVWMGYFNSIFKYGIEKFFFDINSAGVDGVLIVDLPVEETCRIDEYKKYDIDLIRLITPATDNLRVEKILKETSGFIYYVSIKGITGTKEAQEDKIKSGVEFVQSKTNLPVIVGFGIKNAKKAKQINAFADGTITGSALVNIITENISDKNKMMNKIKEFLLEFK